MTTVVLLRHGRTSANAAGVLAGRSPGVGLDDTGRNQAREAAERLAGAPIRAVVSSPLQRCRQTAAIVADRHADLTPIIEAGVIECGYGDWTGRSLKDLASEPLWRVVQEQPTAVRFPNGEAMIEMAARAQQAVRDLDRRFAEEHGPDAVWVLVSHGDVIKAILADALCVHLDAFQRILVDPASISIVRHTETRPYVAGVNTTAGDLTELLTPPKRGRARRGRSGRSRGSRGSDAPVGGGLGARG